MALLKDVSNSEFYFADVDEARDTRVIRSVIMASATETTGWDNAQAVDGEGVLRTIQALDTVTGAGRMNLDRAAEVYVDGTAGAAGADGAVAHWGWVFSAVTEGSHEDFFFEETIPDDTELTVALNWFIGRAFDDETDSVEEEHFANLDLEVWTADGNGTFAALVAASSSLYNNAEFLRFHLPGAGFYGLRVSFPDWTFYAGTAGEEATTPVEYSLAWSAIPEPSTALLLVAAIAAGMAIRRIRALRAESPVRRGERRL